MDQQFCITDKLWLGYSNKTLSQTEIDIIQHHVETCEICSDIKDGIDAMAKPKNLGQTVTAINNKVDELVEPKRKLGVFWYWSAAAVLIFGIGLSWFWVNTTQPIVTINTDSISIAKQTEVKSEFKNESNTTANDSEKKEIPLAINTAPTIEQVPVFESKDREDAKMPVEDMGAGSMSMDDLKKITKNEKSPDTSHYVILPPTDTVPRGIALAFENKVSYSYSATAPPSMESYSLDNVEINKTGTYSVTKTEESKYSKKDKTTSASRKATSIPAPMSNSNINNDAVSNTYSVSKYLNFNDSTNFALAKSHFTQNNFAKCIESLKLIIKNLIRK